MAFIEQLLQGLQATTGDTRAQAAVVADFVILSRPEPERQPLREALDAAAVLRWFDAPLLSRLLGISETEALQRFEALKPLPFIEPFRRGERDVRNVHEATRLGWRRQLARENHKRFQLLSRHAADCFAGEQGFRLRIEWIYHRLGAEPDKAADELEELDRQWTGSAHPEDRDALASALQELEETQLVTGAARVEVLLCTAETRNSRGETSRLESTARTALDAAKSAKRPSAEARAHGLLGDVLQSQGKLAEAQAAFGEYLTICRRLAKQDPSNTAWQRESAVAHSRVGDVMEEQGKLNESQAAFEECLTISRRLVEREPSNTGWQRELAVVRSRVGDILQAQGKLAEAQSAFEERLTIIRRLAEQDPSNAGWQRGLALSHSRVGDALLAQEKLTEAQVAFGDSLTICLRLAEQDPSNARLQRNLAVANNRVGNVLEAQGKLAEAQVAFGEGLTICLRLAEQDPSNASLQRELAVATSRVGAVLRAQGKLAEARAAFGEGLTICLRLAEQDPSNTDWQRELATAHWALAELESEGGRFSTALPLYEEAGRILGELVVRAPGFAQWAKEKQRVESALELCRSRLSSQATQPSDANAEQDSDRVPPPNPSEANS